MNIITTSIKDVSESLKNFYEVISDFRTPKGLDAAIEDFKIKILEQIVSGEDLNNEQKLKVVCTYKKMIKRFQNSENVIELAQSYLTGNYDLQKKVDNDWLSFFFDRVELVSDESIQRIWARVLAGEVENPETYSKSLLHILSIIDKSIAENFCNLSRFCVRDIKDENIIHPLVFYTSNTDYYRDFGLSYKELYILDHLGLIRFEDKREFFFEQKKVFSCDDTVIEVFGDQDNKKRILSGNVTFTSDGMALYKIVGDEYKNDTINLLDFMVSRFKSRKCKVFANNNQV